MAAPSRLAVLHLSAYPACMPVLGLSHMYLRTPLGVLRFSATEEGLTGIAFVSRMGRQQPSALLRAAVEQMREYFAGKRTAFTVPLVQAGTAFQRGVWKAIAMVPYGETASYAAVARAVGKPRAVRAAGSATGVNPLPIVVPCHRIVSSASRDAGHYACGRWRKEWLLRHEAGRA